MRFQIDKQLKCALAAWLLVSTLAGRASAWPSSDESNIFDLTPPAVNTYFTGVSDVFSLEGMEDSYNITVSASYSMELRAARIFAYARNLQTGVDVSTGSATYRITQGGMTVGSGNLTYYSSSRAWDSGLVALEGAGVYTVIVSINGHVAVTTFTAGSLTPVPLTGTATDDNGNPLNGATVKLYNAGTVLSASDLNNLPAPLATTNTPTNGTFVFGNRPVGQYILVIVTANGTTIGPAFWLKSGETTHNETLVENPGRTALLSDLAMLRDSVRSRIIEEQTEWMQDVTRTVDADLDVSWKDEDSYKLILNLVGNSAYSISTAAASEWGDVAARSAAKTFADFSGKLTLTAAKEASVLGQALIGIGTATLPYPPYNVPGLETELNEVKGFFPGTVASFFDPNVTRPILNIDFDSQANPPPHRHDSQWFQDLQSYRFALRNLTNFHDAFVSQLPTLPANYSILRARNIASAADRQIRGIEAGSSLLYVGPDSFEATSTLTPAEPLALNLEDFCDRYTVGRFENRIVSKAKEGSSWVAAGAWTGAGLAGGSALLFPPTAPVAVPAAGALATVGKVAGWASLGLSLIQAPLVAELSASYSDMVMKYNANLVLSPLVMKRTEDFMLAEATSPYYLDASKSFGGKIDDVQLNGATTILGRKVYFPVQLQLSHFIPPIELTGEKTATLSYRNPSGANSPAGYRVEAKVITSSKARSHGVLPRQQLVAGQSSQVTIPFLGHKKANEVLGAHSLECRLWAGPFQADVTTRDFLVIPININVLPLASPQQVETEMRKPLGFVKMEQQSLSGEDIVALADRVRERVETNLVVGANVIERTYAFANDIFEAEFRLYRPPGARLRFTILENGEYIGWDSTLNATHLGFPGAYSGPDANPESISVPNVAGRTLTVRVELDDVATEPINVLVEVWEKPVRNAVLVVLPDSVSIAVQPGQTNSIELGVGESSQQQPLQNVSVSLSALQTPTGQTLPWSTPSWTGATNVFAGSVTVYNVDVDASAAVAGTYTGVVTVTASNAGTVEVPVSVTVDGTAPTINLDPVREWWHEATGPVLSWTGQDNVTTSNNLLYSVFLEGWNTGWSGFSTNSTLDLSGLPDGLYALHVVCRDQALNESTTNALTAFYIDRTFHDSVGDGVLDSWRWAYFGGNGGTTNSLSCANCDPDGDGQNNLAEFLTGTDPTNSASAFRITSITAEGNNIRIAWAAVGGKTNVLEAGCGTCDNPDDPTYSNLFWDMSGPMVIPGSGDVVTNFFDDGTWWGDYSNWPAHYYRVRLAP